MPIISADAAAEAYELVVIGSGFGSLFFLKGLLAKPNPPQRILLLERGRLNSHEWQLKNFANSNIDHLETYGRQQDTVAWRYTLGLGGGTLCWDGETPRLHPHNFEEKTRYGRGVDWPISYEDLEPYYCDAEDIMLVAGENAVSRHWPRSRPYPMPPHRFSTVDEMLKRAQPDMHFALPSARLSQQVGDRPACCASGTCPLCPMDAKFTALNSLTDVLGHPGVDILLNAEARSLDLAGGVVRGVNYRIGGRDRRVGADLVVLGANGIQSPAILLRSGFSNPAIGGNMLCKLGLGADVYLDGLNHYDGGTHSCGANFSLLVGEHLTRHGGAMIYISNQWPLAVRTEYGRWRQIFRAGMIIGTEAVAGNRVELSKDGEANVIHNGPGPDGEVAAAWAMSKLPALFSSLPVERIEEASREPMRNHIQGTLRMGADPAASVVDSDLIMHQARNVVVVGTSVMPATGSVNPSLTAAALSLRAADRLGRAA